MGAKAIHRGLDRKAAADARRMVRAVDGPPVQVIAGPIRMARTPPRQGNHADEVTGAVGDAVVGANRRNMALLRGQPAKSA